jgi:hypothetical protein
MIANPIRPSAYIKHQIPGRVRLKIPQKKGDLEYFGQIAELFADCPHITELQLNPTSASLLICHEITADFLNIADFARKKGLFTIIDKPDDTFKIPNQPITKFASTGINRLDKSLSDFTQGFLDGRSLLFLALIGLAIRQMSKEHFLGASSSLLWYAFRVLDEANGNPFETEMPDDAGS